MSYKLDTATYKRLLVIAAGLPQLQKSHPISGKPMYRAKTEFTGTKNFNTNGKPYQNSFKRSQDPILVDHNIALRNAWEKHGQKGVDDYLGYVDWIVSKNQPVKTEEDVSAE